MNSRFLEYMVFLKLLFAQNARFVSNISIFLTDIFTLILLWVLVRVKIRVTFLKRTNTQAGANCLGICALGDIRKVMGESKF